MNNFSCPVCGQLAEVTKTVALERLTQIHFTCLHCGEKGMDYDDIQPLPLRGTQALRMSAYAPPLRIAMHRYILAAKANHDEPLNKEYKRLREEALAEFKQALRVTRGQVPDVALIEDEEVA